MNPKKRILFIGEAVSLAHVTRPLVLAQALNQNRYEIHFACDPRYQKLIDANMGIHYWPIKSIPSKVFIKAADRNEYAYTSKDLRIYLNEERELLQNIQPSIVIGDYRYTLSTSTELGRIPYAAIANLYYSPYRLIESPPKISVPKIRSKTLKIFRRFTPWLLPLIEIDSLSTLNSIRKKNNLLSLKDHGDLLTRADYTLYADAPGLIQTRSMPSNHFVLGPILWEPNISLPNWWKSCHSEKPLIYVTLGSTGIVDKLSQVVRELAKLPATLAVATAGRIQLIDMPPNVYIANYLPGINICQHASVVLCNGGSTTAYQALSQGVPVVGICSNSDQYYNMKLIEDIGAGVGCSALKLDPVMLRQLVSGVILERRFHTSAAAFAAKLKPYDAPIRFRNFIEGLDGVI